MKSFEIMFAISKWEFLNSIYCSKTVFIIVFYSPCPKQSFYSLNFFLFMYDLRNIKNV